jgi:hypothetical protein
MANSEMELDASGEKVDIVKKVDRFFREAEDYRKEFEHSYEECEDFYAGNHWPVAEERPFKNYCFQAVETEAPLLTDSRPSTDVVPFDSDDPAQDDKAKVLNAAKKGVYQSQNLEQKDAMAVKTMLKVGPAFQYVDWDPDLKNGEGDVCVKNLPWRQVYLDPTASDLDESRFVGFKFPTDIDHLKRRFPKKKDELEKVVPAERAGQSSDKIDENQNLRQHFGRGGLTERYQSQSITTVEEMWLKDYSMEKISDDETQSEIARESVEIQSGINPDISKYEDHEAHMEGHREQKVILAATALQVPVEMVTEEDIERLKEDPEIGLIFQIIDDHISMHETIFAENEDDSGMRPKFPSFMRLVIKVGKTVLFDGPPPVNDGLYPLVTFVCYKDDESIWPIGELHNLIPVQKSLNEMDHAEYSNLRLNGNTGWVCDESSGVDENTLTNDPGLVVIKKQGTEVYRLEAGQTSPQFQIRKQNDLQAMRDITGLGDAIMGQAPTNDPSGEAIKRLAQQQLGRVRLKSRWLEEYTIPRRDRLILSRIVKYYSTERKLRIHDDNGRIKYIDYKPEEMKGFDYDLTVSAGSAAGYDKGTISAIGMQLYQGGLITPKVLIDMVDPPHRGRILEDMAQNDQTKAALQQLQMENLQLKAQFAPEMLTPEEMELINQGGQTAQPGVA